MTDLAGTTGYAYNSRGHLTQETRTAEGRSFVTQYGYDTASGDLAGMTYPGGLAITYRRDGNGQITTVSADETDVVVRLVSYLPFGPVSSMTFGNGLKTDRTHDKRYLMTQSETGSVTDYQYVRDAAGNVLSVSGVGTPDTPSGGKTDSEHEGNRLTKSTGGKAASYAYDGHGNIVSDGTRTFVYNQNNRLAKVTQGETVLGEYSYDGQGRRVRKLASGVVTLYHYDYAGNLIAETDGNGNLLRAYIYLNGERVAMKVYGDQAGMCYFLNDHLGTPQKIVDSSRNVVWEAAYLPFGEAQIVTEIVANNFRFPGQYFDAETGLHYNWHRYYDPKTGRYLTPDPIRLEGRMNLYAYALNNPVNNFDPTGLIADTLADATFVLFDVYQVIVSDPCERGDHLEALVLDILGVVLPGATGLGIAYMAGKNFAKKTIRFGRLKVSAEKFHRVIKPEILKKAGKFHKIVGKNPDIKIVGDKIHLTGTGPFKGRTFKTTLKAADFLR